jgi:hypothetical protein
MVPPLPVKEFGNYCLKRGALLTFDSIRPNPANFAYEKMTNLQTLQRSIPAACTGSTGGVAVWIDTG